MSLAELVALVLSFVLAFSRLLNVARPLWDRGPAWAQVLLPALPPVLAQLAGELGAVQTQLDLVIAITLAVLAVCVAIRGAKPEATLLLVLLAGGVLLSAPGCALLGADKPPAVSPREAYDAARDACAIHARLPADRRSADVERDCASLADVCGAGGAK